ncbi:MAG TPA: HAD family phosphatase [Mucilaginibacter sp.]|jgi:putative hydrolase of the HAD superfamily|nr:HAD family phosphatase [Mucilaginibacter sp.]
MANLENIKNIIFDYGNVIFALDFNKSRQAWIDLGIDNADTFYSHKVQDKIFTEFESGDVRAEEFRAYIRKILEKPQLTDDQIDHAWNSLLVGVPEGNHELLLSLKPRYRTFLLSNINPIHYDHIMRYLKTDFGFEGNDHLFEKVYYSHLVGKRKPDAAIFEQVLNENNLDPAETLFIDDSPQHIEGAKKLGINTYLLTAPDNIQSLFAGGSR